jgi:hypothetical protein
MSFRARGESGAGGLSAAGAKDYTPMWGALIIAVSLTWWLVMM